MLVLKISDVQNILKIKFIIWFKPLNLYLLFPGDEWVEQYISGKLHLDWVCYNPSHHFYLNNLVYCYSASLIYSILIYTKKTKKNNPKAFKVCVFRFTQQISINAWSSSLSSKVQILFFIYLIAILDSLLLSVKILLLFLFLIVLPKVIALKIIVKHFLLLFAITFDFEREITLWGAL